jgi:hypothetical protein
MSAIHTHTVNAIGGIMEQSKRIMLRTIARKIGVEPDELYDKYCTKPVQLRMANTISIDGIAIQDGPVFLEPPRTKKEVRTHTHTRTRTRTHTRTSLDDTEGTHSLREPEPKKTLDDLFTSLTEENKETVNKAITDIRTECMRIVREIGDRMKEGKIFEKEETRPLLKPLNTLMIGYDHIFPNKMRLNRFNRYITNVLHGSDPTKDKRLRNLARDNPETFFDNIILRVKRGMVETLSSES